MAIKLNGTSISTNRLNGSNVTLESLNGIKVFPEGDWRKVILGEVITYIGLNNYYYGGTYTSTPPLSPGVSPTLAIRIDGEEHLISFTGSGWLTYDAGVYPKGSTLPSTYSYGDLFFVTGDGLYISEGNANNKWVKIGEGSSAPIVDLSIIEASNAISGWLAELTTSYPPNNYSIGTTAAMWDGDTIFYIYQVQEA